MPVADVFFARQQARRNGVLVRRAGQRDKEFHLQNWFEDRLATLGLHARSAGRNAFPDFVLDGEQEGYEIKGLATPGRDQNFDANSQMPRPDHDGVRVFYVFGRYPDKVPGDAFPILDLVVCDAALLSTASEYEHRNEAVRGFGSYGDVLLRVRKMYVPPTPYSMRADLAGAATLIVPDDSTAAGDPRLTRVGKIERVEAETAMAGFTVDLRTNTTTTQWVANPDAGRVHRFAVLRVAGDPGVSDG